MILRVSKYPIWPHLWIIPYKRQVPVTRLPQTAPWRTLVGFPASQPFLVLAVTGADKADGHRGLGPLSRDRGEVTLTWICPSFNNNSGALSIDVGTKGLFWPSDDISSSSLCCMGCWEYLGLDRAGVQDLIISGQVCERGWCWPIRSLPLCQ